MSPEVFMAYISFFTDRTSVWPLPSMYTYMSSHFIETNKNLPTNPTFVFFSAVSLTMQRKIFLSRKTLITVCTLEGFRVRVLVPSKVSVDGEHLTAVLTIPNC